MANLSAWELVGLLVGGGLIVLGLWTVRHTRRHLRSDGAHDSSTPTRLTIGLGCLFGGYHALAWSLPAGLIPLRVPIGRWWLVVGLILVAIAGAVLAEWIERRAER